MVNVKDILSFLSENCFEFEYVENKTNVIQGFSSLNKAKNNSIVWIKNIERYVLPDDLQLLVICQEHEFSNMCSNYIFCNNPREIYFEILKEFFVTDKKRI
jgi:UDP-3-O-[3-hydroxymyristoyl] glucosamine N-acyltransferase